MQSSIRTSETAPIDLTGTSFVPQLGEELPEVDLTAPFDIAGVRIEGRVALAPMAGVSVQAFRRQGRRFGASLVCSEMVSSAGLHYDNARTAQYLRIASDEHPIAVQLFGTDPAMMREAAAQVAESGADLIDINMGCPVKKVAKTGAGCAMLSDPDLAVAVASAVVEGSGGLPVMAKIRRGWSNGSRDCMVLGPRLVEEAGIAALTIHPRSAVQMYTGFADHSLTRELVELVDVPVFASGDVTDGIRARAVLALTGAASVMVGRAAQGNPWIVRDMLTNETHLPGPEQRVGELVRFIYEVVREMGEFRATGFLRKFYGWYLRGAGFDKALRNEMMNCGTPSEVAAQLLERFPEARPVVEHLDATVRYPDETDHVIELAISPYGGG
jgi:nifR3 family TIM-barrel protein